MTDTTTGAAPQRRIDSIDLYRGLMMVFMLLDHTRELVHAGALTQNPLDPATTTPLLYATRWISHLCAPGFVLLAGAGVGLERLRGTPLPVLQRFLWTRGLWLMALELFVVRPLVFFNVSLTMLAFLQVIFAIGVSMLALAALIRLPSRLLLAIGLVIVLGHNALDQLRVPPWVGPSSPTPTLLAQLWMVLHQGGRFPITAFPSPIIFAGYPILPWIGVTLVGYGLADAFSWDPPRRKRVFWQLAAALVVAFVAIRSLHGYGDNIPWHAQDTVVKTIMSFMNVQKYPPSLLFLCATLAPCLLALSVLDERPLAVPLARALITFGRVPMFFYLLQWIWAHVAGIVVTAAQGLPIDFYFLNIVQIIDLKGPPPPMGGPLWLVYVVWISGVLALYAPCRWYAGVKARRRDLGLLRYL